MASTVDLHTLLAATGGGLVTLVGTILTFHIHARRNAIDHWSKLQEAQTKFQDEIRLELESTKHERDALKTKVEDLETKVRGLIAQNERLMIEKLEWIQKAASLQMLLHKALQSYPIQVNESLASWFKTEINKIERDMENEVTPTEENDG